jgi:hypothetical protein
MMIAERYGGQALENFLVLGLALLIAIGLRIAG